MPLDTRIALSGQPLKVQFRDLGADYNQLAQMQSAQNQNQLAQMQMQEHQQMAPFRMQQAQTQASMSQLTYDQAKQAQDFVTGVMSKAAEHPEAPDNVVEAAQQMMMHGNKQVQDVGAHLLDSYQKVATFKAQLAYAKESGGGAAPSAMAPAVAVGKINDNTAPLVPSGAVQTAPAAAVMPALKQGGDLRFDPAISVNNTAKLTKMAGQGLIKLQPNEYYGEDANGALVVKTIPAPAIDNKLALAAQGAPPEVANGLVAKAVPSAQVLPTELQAAGAAPALPAKAGAKTAADLMAEIDAGDKKYAPFGVPIPNWKLKRDLLVKQLDEASKPPVMHVVGSNLVGPTGNVVYQGTPDMDFKEVVNKDGTTNILAIDKKKGTSTLVMQGGVAVAGVNPAMADAAKRLTFDKAKFDWEKANPNKTLKEVVQNGVTKYFSVDDRSGVATPVTVAGGKILSGTDTATQRLAFDQAKFAWEKANPGFTIQQTEDGSIVGVNNRTLKAYPVTLNAGPPPSTAPFVGGGGGAGAGAPAAAVGRGAVGVTDGRAVSGEPAGAPATVPLKGKSAGLTESQGNATAFGMRMKESHDLLTNLEKAGATDTGYARGVIGGTLGLTPLIGDKLNDATGNIFNALPAVLGGLNEQQQQTVNARINFITALLRKESGAAIGPSEFSTAEKLYFPQPGNPPSVIAQKQRARELAIQAMKIQAGPGAKNISAAQGEGATSESDPLGIRN